MYVNDTQTTTVKHNGKVLSGIDGHWQRRTFEVNEPVHAEPSINGSSHENYNVFFTEIFNDLQDG